METISLTKVSSVCKICKGDKQCAIALRHESNATEALSYFFLVLAVSVGSITAVVSYLIYQEQLARFGDVFDRVVFQQTQAWGMPALIAIFGITLMINFVIIGH